jgi:uncharacterized protein
MIHSQSRRSSRALVTTLATVLLLAFAVATRMPAHAETAPLTLNQFPRGLLSVRTMAGTVHHFEVWLAERADRRQQGLMYVRTLDEHSGMLFVFPQTQSIAMWMKNTYVPLDMIFITAAGRIDYIAANTQPLSLEVIEAPRPVKAVLEVAAGTAQRLGLVPGDQVLHAALTGRQKRRGSAFSKPAQ